MTSPLALRITGRSSSHFTRVVTMVARELHLDYQLEVVHDLKSRDVAVFGGHPALKIPTLHVGESHLFGTENICRKLLELAGRRGDPRIVLCEHVTDELVCCAQELVWNAMATQVNLRMGIWIARLPADNVYFEKARTSLNGALSWLEANFERARARLPTPRDLSMFEITLFCLVDHLLFLPSVPMEPYPALRGFVAEFGQRPAAQQTGFHFDPAPAVPPP